MTAAPYRLTDALTRGPATPPRAPAPAVPLIPAPDPTPVKTLLRRHHIPAHVTGWTGWHRDHGQTSGGLYVIPFVAGPDQRAQILDLLIDHGYTIAELDGGTLRIDLPHEDW